MARRKLPKKPEALGRYFEIRQALQVFF